MAAGTTLAPGAGDRTLTYNGPGQMTRAQDVATDTSYAYAGSGQNELITRTVAGGDTTKYVYGRPSKYGVPMVDVMTVNGANHHLDNGPDGTPLALELPSGGTGYFVLDGLGSVVALIDGQGNLETTYTYGPYGEPLGATGTGPLADANPYRHHTGLLDPSTGYLKHGTRWNDTDSGRWTTVDPITRLTDPNRANAYAFAGSNPLNYVDPTGLIDWNAVVKAGFGSMIAGIIVGAGVGCVTSIELGCVPGAVAGATSGGLTGLVGGTVTALYLELAFGGQ